MYITLYITLYIIYIIYITHTYYIYITHTHTHTHTYIWREKQIWKERSTAPFLIHSLCWILDNQD